MPFFILYLVISLIIIRIVVIITLTIQNRIGLNMNALKYILSAVGFSVLTLVFTGCGGKSDPENKPIKVVATVGMVADIVREVVGDHAEVSSLIGEGIDPHLYKPTRDDVLQLSNADVIFYNGLLLEGKMADILEKLTKRNGHVYAVAGLISEDQLLSPVEFGGHHDPHIWMDVSLWSRGVDLVQASMAAYNSSWSDELAVNASRYKAELDLLHTYILEIMQTVPEDSRVLITAHDAFNYYGRAYGFEVLGIQGISTESEAGLNDINRLVDIIVDRGIRAIFVESSVADRNVKALVEGAKSRGHDVIIGGSLFSDAMGGSGTYEGTYIGMMDHNGSTIARALGGQVPEGGFRAWKESQK